MEEDGIITSRAAADDEKASSSGLLRIVWFRQMIHRWQSSSSTTTTKRSPIAGGHGDPAGASTNDEGATLDSGSERNPLLPRMVVVEERAHHGHTHTHGHGGCHPEEEDLAAEGGGDSPMTPAGSAPADVPRGCCPVYVGDERRRFVVPTAYLGMPVFRRLLEKAEEEFEFHYHGGALPIPCDTEAFKYILLVMDRHRQGLVDDEGNAATPKHDDGEQGGSSSRTPAGPPDDTGAATLRGHRRASPAGRRQVGVPLRQRHGNGRTWRAGRLTTGDDSDGLRRSTEAVVGQPGKLDYRPPAYQTLSFLPNLTK